MTSLSTTLKYIQDNIKEISREDALSMLRKLSDKQLSTDKYYWIDKSNKQFSDAIMGKFIFEYAQGTIYDDNTGERRIRCMIGNKYRVDLPWK